MSVDTDVPVRVPAQAEPLLEIEDLVVEFDTQQGTVHALSGVDLVVGRGETLSIVGESGSGKSTLVKAILGLTPAKSGTIRYADTDLLQLDRRTFRRLRADLQLIMQDPVSSLNPRWRVNDIVAEGLRIWPDRVRSTVAEQVDEGLDAVGMSGDEIGHRKPGQFSGGQCQRIAIARALAVRPEALFCDEAVSALDVSVQAMVINLLADAKERFGLTMVFVSHDLGVVKSLSDRVMVMYLGRVCEVGSVYDVFESPQHPYTHLLLASAPGSTTEPEQVEVAVLPSPLDPPSGCRFRTRCLRATELCAREAPPLATVAPGHAVACHHPVTADRPTLR